ncbi:MAG TPA: DegT/DnrJ/EryC1/StrS family aminotransferase [Candidatus Cloacimonadota bacterium]|nr:DegT/DnrJ/EryC1/StrS family aminotransferase [Candidatus Cloacimonadota bacterium]HPT71940.1 DegT/DnrJ/EryC1/StrS family aminotransferase [Candidatus Cloacimonadota bacterium]
MIRLFKPYLGTEELQNIQDAFQRGWIGLGPKVTEFEEKWGKLINCPNTMALNSATAALHLAVTNYNFPRGKKILVPAITFVATASTVLYNQLEPIFVDVDPVTLQMDVKDLERKYTPDCVAVIPVHFTGYPSEIDAIVDFAGLHDLKVIEDCAHTGVGIYKGKRLGTWGDIGCYSFEEKKCMTTGDGGMICSKDPGVVTNLRPYRWVGIDKDTWRRAKKSQESMNLDAMHWHYEISVLGYKYNMNDLAASIGLAQLTKLDYMNQARGSHIDRYLEGMKDLKHIKPLVPYDTKRDIYHIFGVRCEKRDELIIFLTSKGISTGVHYYPLTLQPLFKKYNVGCETANSLWRTFITLPMFVELQDGEIDYILEALHEFEKVNWS